MPKTSKHKVVLDTNVFVVSLRRHHKYHWILEQFRLGNYDLYVTNEILTEYLEVATNFYGLAAADSLISILLQYPNLLLVDPRFQWNLISADPDDNKFVDCAVSAGADFIVSQDKHFNVLKQIPFPKMDVIDVESFAKILNAVS